MRRCPIDTTVLRYVGDTKDHKEMYFCEKCQKIHLWDGKNWIIDAEKPKKPTRKRGRK